MVSVSNIQKTQVALEPAHANKSIATSMKEYLTKLVAKFKTPKESKTAEVFSKTHPMPETPSSENVVAPQAMTPLQKLQNVTKDYKPDSTTAKILKLVDPAKTPHLPQKEEFHAGGTGYIDGVRAEDMTHPVMWGIDSYDRPYVALKMKVVSSTMEPKGKVGVETIFQRYTDSANTWTSGSHYGLNPNLVSSTIQKEEFANLTKLMQGETVKLSRDYGETVVKLA